MLPVRLGGTAKNAAGGKPPRINSASAILPIGTNPICHRAKVKRQIMQKIEHLRCGNVETMTVVIKITADTAHPARGLQCSRLLPKPVINLLNPLENQIQTVRRNRILRFAVAQFLQNSTKVPD